jgi:hypothetical protein
MNLKDLLKIASVVATGLTVNYLISDCGISQCVWGAVASLAGGALSYLGSKKSSKGGGETPDPINIFQPRTKMVDGKKVFVERSLADLQAAGMLDYYKKNIPGFVALQKKFGPELMKQSLRESQQYLTGVGGQQGLFGLTERAGREAQKQIADLRARELATMSGQTGRVRNLMDKLSPEQARAIDLQQAYAERAQGLESEFQGQAAPYTGMFGTMAEEAYARRGTLSPEEQRETQQQARESAAAAGRIGGNSAISSEIMNREAAQAARRAEAQQAAQTAYGNIADVGARRQALRGEASGASGELFNRAASFYTAPGMSLLSGTPAAFGAGTGLLSAGMQGAAANTGQFDYNMPLNFANQLGGAQNQANMANYSMNTQNRLASANALGQFGSTLMSAGMSGGMGTSFGNFGSFLGSGNMGNAGTAFGNMGRESMGLPLRAYTV